MKIWRLECQKCKLGPYHCHCIHWSKKRFEMYDNHTLGKHPTMSEDLLGFNFNEIDFSWFCAFAKRKQLTKWFRGYLRHLLTDQEFKIVAYNVPLKHIRTSKSGKQVFFRRE